MNLTTEQWFVLTVQVVIGFCAGFFIRHFQLRAQMWKRLYHEASGALVTTQIQNSRLNWEVMYLNQKIAVLEGEDWKQ